MWETLKNQKQKKQKKYTTGGLTTQRTITSDLKIQYINYTFLMELFP